METEANQQLLTSDSPQFILQSQEAFQTWIARVGAGPSEPRALDLSPELVEELRSVPQPRLGGYSNILPRAQHFDSENIYRLDRSRRQDEDPHQDFPRRPDPYDQEVEIGLARNMSGNDIDPRIGRTPNSLDPLAPSPHRL